MNAEFHFKLDVCADKKNAKCSQFFTKDDDGLKQPWFGPARMNPPYGSEIKLWVRKALEASHAGTTVVCLLPARTDTSWWHDYVLKADDVRLLRGRLKFGGAKHNAPFPNAVVVFRGMK